MILKKILTTFLVLGLLCVPAFAANHEKSVSDEEDIIIQPRFSYINVFQNTFDISSSGKASVTVYINASNVDQCRVVAYLKQYKNGVWTTIKSWSAVNDGTSCGIGKTYYVPSGYSYRLESYGYVYSKGMLVESTYYISTSQFY